MTNKVTRIDRDSGKENMVDLDYAVNRIAESNLSFPSNTDKKTIKHSLLIGGTMVTKKFLYEMEV